MRNTIGYVAVIWKLAGQSAERFRGLFESRRTQRGIVDIVNIIWNKSHFKNYTKHTNSTIVWWGGGDGNSGLGEI